MFPRDFADFEYGEGCGHLEFQLFGHTPGASDKLTWSSVAGRRIAGSISHKHLAWPQKDSVEMHSVLYVTFIHCGRASRQERKDFYYLNLSRGISFNSAQTPR